MKLYIDYSEQHLLEVLFEIADDEKVELKQYYNQVTIKDKHTGRVIAEIILRDKTKKEKQEIKARSHHESYPNKDNDDYSVSNEYRDYMIRSGNEQNLDDYQDDKEWD